MHRLKELSGNWESRCGSDHRIDSANRTQRSLPLASLVRIDPLLDCARRVLLEAVEAAARLALQNLRPMVARCVVRGVHGHGSVSWFARDAILARPGARSKGC